MTGWTVESYRLFLRWISLYMLKPSFLWITDLCSFSISLLDSYCWSPMYNRNICYRSFEFMSCLSFYPFWEHENILRFLPVCLWLNFLHLDFNPSGIYFCVCCEVGIILHFFPKRITSCRNTIYWIIHLFLTDLKYHLYHILNPHIFLGLFLGCILFLDLFVWYCAGKAPL